MKNKEIDGTISLEEALEEFKNESEENKDLLERVDMINSLISFISYKRSSYGYTQRDFAKITGIKQPMIARIEAGTTIPRLDTFVKMIHGLNCDIIIIDKKDK